jgi:hypothetical protein
VWCCWRTRNRYASTTPTEFRETRKARVVSDRRWSDDILVGWPRRGPSTYNGRVQPSKLRCSPRWQGILLFFFHFIVFFLTNVPSDVTSSLRKPILRACQRHYSEDEGDETWTILSPSVYCQRGWRATLEAVGSELFDPGSCRCFTKLPAVHLAIERQGEDAPAIFWVTQLTVTLGERGELLSRKMSGCFRLYSFS